jgi:hypothetical protein
MRNRVASAVCLSRIKNKIYSMPKISNHRKYKKIVPYHDVLTGNRNKSTALGAAHYLRTEF